MLQSQDIHLYILIVSIIYMLVLINYKIVFSFYVDDLLFDEKSLRS
jgi:hypothetical protein